MENNKRIVFAWLMIGTVVLGIFFLLLSFRQSGNQGGGVTPTPTVNTKSYVVDFSGFNSNLSLTGFPFSNADAVNFTQKALPVYTSQQITRDYLATKLSMTKNQDLGVYQNTLFSLISTPTVLSLQLRAPIVNGGITQKQAEDTVLGFLHGSLGLDIKNVLLTTSLSGKNYSISVYYTVGGYKVLPLDGTAPIQATISSSGQIAYIVFNNAVYNFTQKDLFAVSFTPPRNDDSFYIGKYSSDIPAGTTMTLIATKIDITSYEVGYYMDYSSGSVIPVIHMITKVSTLNGAKSYNVSLLIPVIPKTSLTSVPSQNTQGYLNGYQQ